MNTLEERQEEMRQRLEYEAAKKAAIRANKPIPLKPHAKKRATKLPPLRFTMPVRPSKAKVKFNSITKRKFWDKVHRTDGCWLWLGPLASHGYGHFSFGRLQVLAHRYSWEIANWEISESRFHVHHLCKNRICVRPDHLQLLTPDEHGKMHRHDKK